MADDTYTSIRDGNILGPFVGRTVVDITQQDAEEWAESCESYVMFHFDNGGSVRFPIGDEGFQILDAPDSEPSRG